MSYFLLVYDRDAGTLLRKQEYALGSDAMRARFAAETEFGARSEIEIVVLAAESEVDLRTTHARYFLGLTELANRMG
jgi:hypothetical protein